MKLNTLRDHPRRCGENAILRRPIGVTRGSPPQVRGNPIRIFPCPAATGITPAGAGKTKACSLSTNIAWDHPRRCGENPVLHDFRAVSTGSPPQVRGKPNAKAREVAKFGITPAGAGKTYLLLLAVKRERDHPRRCGENHNRRCMLTESVGSPPQVRGKLMCACMCGKGDRITPAGAGKTKVVCARESLTQDHPRRCGENFPPRLGV